MTSAARTPRPQKTLLYCGPDPEAFQSLVGSIAEVARAEVLPAPAATADSPAGLRLAHPRSDLTILPAYTVPQALDTLAGTFLNLLVIDLRFSEDEAEQQARVAKARELLRTLDDVDDVERRFGFHRIVVLVSGPDGAFIDNLLVELGSLGVRHVLKERRFRAGETPRHFARRVLGLTMRLLFAPRNGQIALISSGGGITAIFFELGAIKALDDCLPDLPINDLDMFFGISAGAVVNSAIAQGFAPEEFMAAIDGREGGRIPPVNLSLARLSNANLADMRQRLGIASRAVVRAGADVLRRRPGPTVDDIFLGATALVGAPFHSDAYEALLRRMHTRPGATNDFRLLRRPLFIGATNQDARRHTLFGDEDNGDTPISRAVQASLSINPAFSSVEIGGTWYEDGAITRTSNFSEAIRRGAELIFVFEPFVPYHSREPGFAHRRGMLYNIDQNVRSLSFTRFETERNHSLRRHPEVSSYTFLPNNRLRHLLSINPMDHRIHLEAFRGSYLSTLRRLQGMAYRLRGDLGLHGIRFDTAKAEAVAERLEHAGDKLRLEDFFPDGRVVLPERPLSLQ